MRGRFIQFLRGGGFTLVEMLVSMVILTLLLLMLVSITTATQRTWAYTNGKVEQFRDAREAFESMTRKLSQATLNTYWDYHYPANATSTTPPDGYIRQSELRFISGNAATLTDSPSLPSHAVFFQAPLGCVNSTTDYGNLNALLNTWGYFIEFGSDKPWWPDFVSSLPHPPAERYRYRMMELMEPSDQLSIYSYTSGTDSSGLKAYNYNGNEWFTNSMLSADRPVRVLAENIIALILIPKLSSQEDPTGAKLAPAYLYNSGTTGAAAGLTGTAAAAVDSKNQLPPIMQVTMVAVDDASFSRFLKGNTAAPSALFLDGGGHPLFQSVGDMVDSANPGYAQDLNTLQKNLRAKRINYRVFTSDVSIKAAKWSRLMTN